MSEVDLKEKVAKAHGCVAAKWPSLASYGDGAVMVIFRLPQRRRTHTSRIGNAEVIREPFSASPSRSRNGLRRRTIPLVKRQSWHSSGNLHMLFPP